MKRFAFAFVSLAASISLYGADAVYKWTDENGVVHFSSRKAVESAIEVRLPASVTTSSQALSGSNEQAPPTLAEAAETLLEKRNREARKELCDRGHADYNSLSSEARIFVTDEKTGAEVPLSDADRKLRQERAFQAIKQHCEKVEPTEGS